MTALELIIFDCDGVLFDSSDANVAFYDAVLHAIGMPPLSGEWRRRAHVMAASQLIDAMFGNDPVRHGQATRVAREIDYSPFFALMTPVPELASLLAGLRRSYRLAMATNRGRTVGEVVRRFALDRYLELAVGVLDVARPKPHPDMIERCLAHFGVRAPAALYVGDAETDGQAARAAGVDFVAVGTAEWAEQRIGTLAELPHWLERRANGRGRP